MSKHPVEQDAMLQRAPDILLMVKYWNKVNAVLGGLDTMREGDEEYLPRFTQETDDNYSYRKKLTKFTNVYRDIVESLASKPFEEEVSLPETDGVTIPKKVLEFIENVDGAGNNLTVFAANTFFNGINSAVDWIFVDFPSDTDNIRTQADVKAAGVRPWWSHVLGCNVLGCQSTMVGSKETITHIRIFEPGKPDHVRIIENYDGVITWQLWRKTDKWHDLGDGRKTMFIIDSTGTFEKIDRIPLIPFVTGRRDGRSWNVEPPMRGAVELQVDLYQDESGLKYIKTLTAYPMLSGNGITPPLKPGTQEPATLLTGPNRVLYAPPGNNGEVGSWAFVEPSSQSMTFLANNIKEAQQQLRELGKQPLTAQSSGITVINSAAAANKSKTTVKQWAFGLKDALENAMVITCQWLGIDQATYDPTVYVFTEFDEFIDGKDLEDLNTMRAARDISRKTLWHEKKRRGVLSSEFVAEKEELELLNETPGDGEDNDGTDNPPPTKDKQL